MAGCGTCDHLMDVTLGSAAIGLRLVDLKGVSFVQPQRFILVDIMNP